MTLQIMWRDVMHFAAHADKVNLLETACIHKTIARTAEQSGWRQRSKTLHHSASSTQVTDMQAWNKYSNGTNFFTVRTACRSWQSWAKLFTHTTWITHTHMNPPQKWIGSHDAQNSSKSLHHRCKSMTKANIFVGTTLLTYPTQAMKTLAK